MIIVAAATAAVGAGVAWWDASRRRGMHLENLKLRPTQVRSRNGETAQAKAERLRAELADSISMREVDSRRRGTTAAAEPGA